MSQHAYVRHESKTVYGFLTLLNYLWKIIYALEFFGSKTDISMVFDTCENVSQSFRMMGPLLDRN